MTAAFLALSLLSAGAERDLWLYHSTNLWVEANVQRVEELLGRAARAGYRKVLLADSKFSRLADMDRRYFANVEKVKTVARELGLEVVPALFPVGYSNSLLWHDPNLAEGLPVRNALFVVEKGQARLVPDPAVSFRPQWDWKDEEVRIEEGIAAIRDNRRNARMAQKLEVAPFRAYHVAVKIRTRGFRGDAHVRALGKTGKPLHFLELHLEPTQDWKEAHVVFNSLENEEATVYLGVWGEARGEIAFRDWRIEEAGLVNVLRREGAPSTVEGRREGVDYEPIRDPRMGNVPYNGEYEVWHEPPTIRTRLPDGTRLRVSWHHPAIIHQGQVPACLSEPRTLELLADEARRVREAWGAKSYMMSHDEVRALNRDLACARQELSPGKILAENARRCAELLAGSTVHVWSDMFDPHHNAVKDYYLVRGDLSGSWEGLPREVVIVNWNFGEREKSLRFFAGRGHRQVIAGYYDARPEQVKDWLQAARGVEGVIGIMYTTWQNRYQDLEEFARLARE